MHDDVAPEHEPDEVREVSAPPPEPSGIAAVDAVVADVAALGDRPLDEHAAVFGRAHEELRRALDDDPEPA